MTERTTGMKIYRRDLIEGAQDLAWSPDSKTLYFTAENETLQPIYAMAAKVGATPKKLVGESFNNGIFL